jgi:hypothetical protein
MTSERARLRPIARSCAPVRALVAALLAASMPSFGCGGSGDAEPSGAGGRSSDASGSSGDASSSSNPAATSSGSGGKGGSGGSGGGAGSGGSSPAAYEGFGAEAIGGANSSDVYHVTNLDSSGPGSLANGIASDRTIVFDVSGTIRARLDLVNISYLTIDATGQDITIDNEQNGDGISFDGPGTHHVILKNIRVINAGGDGINVVGGAHDILITNCSAYDNGDGNIDVAGDDSGHTRNVTVQYSIIGPHVSEVGGTLVTGQSVSIHHNLYAPASPGLEGERCPLVHCNYSPVGSPNADIRNNLVWRFGRENGAGSGYGTAVAYDATANVVNNYYYTDGTSPGSATNTDDGYGNGATGLAFISGNVSGNDGVNANASSNHQEYEIPAAYRVTTQDACAAAARVLADAGPQTRSAIEQALIDEASALPGCP